ncbi:MAG: hypothetical protein COT81_04575 [Candidatus Buchananbacteria bacterium CG10_big_fil_rev_8_21_14_0_10_42_9]|uniref:O-antigen ligase-related domain-containing protein n=1 Tax=Candidatus Buchananbacteria bacterium CG10_big_fil_rev_8_21_14_0_10_42_9 TaxID=1974526 RepID=A0A2H0W0B8_9BACT|nr:MAG: hypothetical protein COT81_04575 [Candidatus Buchananbacteria bacterium CG10_big_fil_rev_8_21_14_0_10_42_9]
MKATKVNLWIIAAGLAVICAVPLVVGSGYLFPYIFPKNLIFRIVTEIIFLAYLLLAYRDKNYRLKLSWVHIIFFLFVLASFASSIFGPNFYLSFWGDIERSEGLITWLHLVMLFVVVTGTLKHKKEWLMLLDVFVVLSVPIMTVGLLQWQGVEWIANTTGDRISSTVGNAAFFAGYLIFVLGFALYLFFQRTNLLARIYYGLVSFWAVAMILLSGTRGAVLALLAAGFLSLLTIIVYSQSKKIKIGFSVGTIIIVLFLAWVVTFGSSSALVQQSNVLNRLSGLSVKSRTAQTRLWTWGSAWKGFLDRPILGYGNENFTVPFDKYFDPRIIEDEGSVIWFDRAHNIVFDRLIPGGLIGFGLYAILLGYAFFIIWRKHKAEDGHPEIVLFILLVAYVVQNLFVFDSISTFIPWIFILSWVAYYSPKFEYTISKEIHLGVLAIFFLVFVFSFNAVNLKPAKAVKLSAKALRSVTPYDYRETIDNFNQALNLQSYASQEIRVQMVNTMNPVVANGSSSDREIANLAADLEQLTDEQLAENDVMVRNYKLAIEALDTGSRFAAYRLDKAIDLANKAIALSPKRIPLYYDLGLLHIKKALDFKDSGDLDLAAAEFQLAEKAQLEAIALNPPVVESHVGLVALYIAEGNDDRAIQALADLEGNETIGDNYPQPRHLLALGQWSEQLAAYRWIKKFYQDLLEFEPRNVNYMVKLATAHAFLGEDEEAISLAEHIAAYNLEPYVTQSQKFIEQVKNGFFKAL